MKKDDIYYTSDDLADKLKYKGRETFLKALRENYKFERGNLKLSAIWRCRERIAGRFLFNKDQIDKILRGKNV